jgi:crossover junction endodeoxyribonuclease RusA
MTEAIITLPYPPSVNSYKKAGRLTTTLSGKVFQPRVNTEATKRFYFEVWKHVRVANIKCFGGDPVCLEMDIYPPDKRKRDIDNGIKPVLDALQHAGLYDDDNQVMRLLVTRCEILKGGQIVIRIRNLT